MNTTQRSLIMQRWDVLQYDLIPELRLEHGALTPKLEKLVHILDRVRIEEWPVLTWRGGGRKPHERSALANAFVAKAVLGLTTTRALIERLQMDRTLKRLCGFSMWRQVPDEATFSRAFRAKAGLTQDAVAERMGTTKSAISRLESVGRHAPSLATLKKYASAVGCDLQVRLVPHKAT